jgi:twitching motility protein PilT
VILIGEIRDQLTMSIALTAANTGHLVFSTLHTVDAAQAVNRIISFFPPHQHQEIRFLMASCMEAIVSLRLVPRTDKKGRVPATEVMIATGTVKEFLADAGRTHLVKNVIEESTTEYGMQSFDQSLLAWYNDIARGRPAVCVKPDGASDQGQGDRFGVGGVLGSV